jgi:hypothetical protein
LAIPFPEIERGSQAVVTFPDFLNRIARAAD